MPIVSDAFQVDTVNGQYTCILPITTYSTIYWLSKFVIEVRNSCGNVYPPNTLYSVCCGIQRYIKDHRPQINIFKDAGFSGFAKTLDSEMKRLRSIGVGVNKNTGRTTDNR